MVDDNIEHREFWKRIDKIKTDFGVNIKNSELDSKILEARVLEFYAILQSEAKTSEYVGERKNDPYKRVLEYISSLYRKHFNITEEKFGKIEGE